MKKLISLITLAVIANTLFAEQKEVEIKGEVVGIDEVSEKSVDVNVLRVQIRTQAREMIMAHLGPAWSLGMDIKKGDQIAVKCRLAEENQFMVREMICNNVKCQVRDENYSPLWLRTSLREEKCFYNPQKEKVIKCRIEEMYVCEPSLMLKARVKAENGETIEVRFAPEWYLQSRIRIGDEIELRGSQVKSDAQVMFLARETRNLRTKQEISLRNNEGFPLWQKTKEGSRGSQTGGVGKKEGARHGER